MRVRASVFLVFSQGIFSNYNLCILRDIKRDELSNVCVKKTTRVEKKWIVAAGAAWETAT